VLDKVLLGDADKIRQTLDGIDREAFYSAVEKIVSARNIYILGVRSSAALADFLIFNFRMMFDNVRAVEGTTGTEIFEQLLNIGPEDVLIAMGPSSKLRNNASKGWKLKEIKIEPYVGIPATNVIYIVDNCPHPNAAKLLVRWMMGEADGTGEGNKPWQTLGGWSVRDDIPDTEGMATLEEMNIVPADPVYVYENVSDLIDFGLEITG
jgi:hypothetical protein